MGKYFDMRERYFNDVIKYYSEGMTGAQIAKVVPVSDSTIYRWIEEHIKKIGEVHSPGLEIPRTPRSVAKTIRAMHSRITELECRLELAEMKNAALVQIIQVLKDSNLI